jgi:N6-adenosine-specific RNA methylase IME4
VRQPEFQGLPQKKYNTLVIDPPWPVQTIVGGYGTKSKYPNQSRNKRPDTMPYKTLDLKAIKSFPLASLAEQGAHIYCWTTNRFLPAAFGILEGWGVRYHLTMPLVKKSGIAPCKGYVFGSEYCLLGFAGRPMQPFLKIGRLNWLLTAKPGWRKMGLHSRKPQAFYDLVEEMSPGPRIDLFARRPREAWDVWGDELEDDESAPS